MQNLTLPIKYWHVGTHAKFWRHTEKCWCAGARTKFWCCAKKCWHVGVHAKVWHHVEKCWCAGAHAKLSIVMCGLSDACVILLRGVHMHSKVHAVCIHIIMACMVCAMLAECRETLLVCTQCEYMLSHNSLVNGVDRVLVCGGGIQKFGMVQCTE
jgi:hypothetical protein